MPRGVITAEFTVRCGREAAHRAKVSAADRYAAGRMFREMGWKLTRGRDGWVCRECAARRCSECGRPFPPRGNNQKTCGRKCADARSRAKTRARTAVLRLDPGFRKKQNAACARWRRDRYKNDPAYREKVREQQKQFARRSREEGREWLKQSQKRQLDNYHLKKRDPQWYANRRAKEKVRLRRLREEMVEAQLAAIAADLEAKHQSPSRGKRPKKR